MTRALWRKVAAEGVGTAVLVAAIVGSAIMAQRLSPADAGLQLLENAVATAAVLFVLITVLGPVSGAHFNPVVTGAIAVVDKRAGSRWSVTQVVAYVASQLVGGVSGALVAQAMFETAPAWSTTERSGAGLWLAEVVATAGLVGLIVILVRSERTTHVAAAVATWIGTAFWFTSSTAFANPAVTIGRTVTDTLSGIAPGSAPAFLIAQLVGAGLGLAGALALVPRRTADAR